MDQVSFQNGFFCGMTTKGLVRSGQIYQPIIWNDAGVYSYFYIDFRRAMQTFSFGMLTESIIIYDSVQVNIMGTEKVNETTYKIYANITGLAHGITVINKKTSRLKFTDGDALPPFSTHMFILGQTPFIDGGWVYEKLQFPTVFSSPTESFETINWSTLGGTGVVDSTSMTEIGTSVDKPTITLT